MGEEKLKKHLELVKGLGLLLLLFVLASAVAVSENTYRSSVTIMQSSSSGDGDEAYTVINAYTRESDSPEMHVTGIISGSGSSIITNQEDMDKDNDKSPAKGADSGTMPAFQFGELTPEEYNGELSEWILSTLDRDPFITIGDFPEDLTDMIKGEH
jgi:hypothetical protein